MEENNKKSRGKSIKIVFLFLAIFFIIGIMSSSNYQDDKKVDPDSGDSGLSDERGLSENRGQNSQVTNSAINITAKQLNEDYQANTVAADDKYKGKFVIVTGTVNGIDKDIFDNPFVSISTGELFQDLLCQFDKQEVEGIPEIKDKLTSLSKGNVVTLIGKVNGLLLGSVKVDNCEFYDQQ